MNSPKLSYLSVFFSVYFYTVGICVSFQLLKHDIRDETNYTASFTHVLVGGFQNQRLQLIETFVYAFATTSFNQRLLYLQPTNIENITIYQY